jgi:1-deoxy-D-xylulose-5-phosphate reductoisomerase
MRLHILYALGYPERLEAVLVPTRLERIGALTFETVPEEKFPALGLAYRALQKGGTAPAALSAADEVAVAGFLEGNISFPQISQTIAAILQAWPDEPLDSLERVLEADKRARQWASEEMKKRKVLRMGLVE